MRIAVITSKTAEPLIREVVEKNKKRYPENLTVQIIALPVAAIGMLDSKKLNKLLSKVKRLLQPYDVILVPGTIAGDVSVISDSLRKPVYKASRDPGLLPLVIAYLGEGGSLDTQKPAEDLFEAKPPEVIPEEIAFEIGGVEIPYRGPPLVLIAEIPPSALDYCEMAERYVDEGAKILIVGASHETRDLQRRIRVLKDKVNVPIISEAPTPHLARKAVAAGADGISISAAKSETYIDVLDRDHVVILGERDLSILAKAVQNYRSRGYEKIVIDPVVGLPLIDYTSTSARYRTAYGIGAPMLFSAANAATVLDADTHGIYALLAAVSIELRASLFLVVEDSYKTIHSVAEAREALKLGYHAWSRRVQPHMLGSRLLVIKQLEPPPKPTIPLEDVVLVEEWIEPEMERGYFRIEVDHENGFIIAEYHIDGIVKRWASRKARLLARAITREVKLSAEHAAYLGEELAKAELALRMGRTYIQDSDVLRMVWES